MSHAANCRSCGSGSLETVLKWEPPRFAPASAMPTSRQADRDALAFCPKCLLVQRVRHEPAEVDLSNTDLGVRGETTSWPLRQLTSQVIAIQKLRPTSLVLQIGSRDGRLLADYQSAGIPVLGIEPAVKFAELARLERSIPTLCRHFDKYLATHLVACGQPADVIHVNQILQLVDDPNGLIAGLPIVLKDSGIAVLEVPYVRHAIDRGSLWSSQQSELAYFSLTSLENLLVGHGLVIHDVERTADGGTSLRLFLGKQGETSARVADLLTEEHSWGVNRLEAYLPRRHAKVA